MAPVRQGHPRPGGRGPARGVRTPGPPDDGGVGVRLRPRGCHRHLRRDHRLHDRVRQPPPVDEAEDDQELALRQLPRGLAGQPAALPRADPTRSFRRPTRWRRSGRRPTRSTTTCTRARSACCVWPSARVRESTTRSSGPRSARTGSRCSAATAPDNLGNMTPPQLTEIDHVAIAVRDLDGAVGWYEAMFGATVAHREVVERDGVEEALLKVADSYVQLLTPVREDSTVAKWLDKNGEGIHHVGYRVDSVADVLASYIEHGGRSIDPAPRPGSRGTTVAFLHPKARTARSDRTRPGVAPAPRRRRAAVGQVDCRGAIVFRQMARGRWRKTTNTARRSDGTQMIRAALGQAGDDGRRDRVGIGRERRRVHARGHRRADEPGAHDHHAGAAARQRVARGPGRTRPCPPSTSRRRSWPVGPAPRRPSTGRAGFRGPGLAGAGPPPGRR